MKVIFSGAGLGAEEDDGRVVVCSDLWKQFWHYLLVEDRVGVMLLQHEVRGV